MNLTAKKEDFFDLGWSFRIYPNSVQQIFIQKTFGCCRKVYNCILVDQNNSLKKSQARKFYTCAK